jgi:hypothetical protein
METDGLTLTDDEVRERFSAYHDGELPEGEAAAVRKRLDENRGLATEYERFCSLLGGIANLGMDPNAELKPGVPAHGPQVDLLAGVQARLHRRSAGKFYRSRWARTVGVFPYELMAVVVLVLLLIAYVCMTYVSGLRPAESPSGPVQRPTAPVRPQ